jgi:dihydropteroate synthase
MQTWHSPHGRTLPPIGPRTLIMGVLNVTPESFSDGGLLCSPQAVVDRAGAMLEQGADVLDVGGESTLAGAVVVQAGEELARVLPSIEALRQAFPQVAISIDTYKAAVADAALAAGADIVNDIWGLMHGLGPETREAWHRAARENRPLDGDLPVWSPMAKVAAQRRAPVVVMHNRLDRNYTDFWADVLLDLQASVFAGRAAGIAPHQIWLDPGFGFAKNVPHNLEILRDLGRIVALGHPVLVGTSRKSTLSAVLGGAAMDDRLEGSGATAVWAIQQGCHMIRVHDVHEMTRFARIADAIKAGLAFSAL